jgi:hypothetical protein
VLSALAREPAAGQVDLEPRTVTRHELEAIVAWWIPRLGLTHWDISVCWSTEDDDNPFQAEDHTAHASTYRCRDYDVAKVYFNPREHKDWNRVTAHRHAVHELLHLVTREVEFVLDMLDGQLHRDVDTLVTRSHRHGVEGAIDRLAYRFVELAGITEAHRP